MNRKSFISMLLIIAILISVVPAINSNAASKKVTMYVVISYESGNKFRDSKINYTKNGLIKSVIQGNGKGQKFIYSYNGKKITKWEVKNKWDDFVPTSCTYTYDNKGRISGLESVDSQVALRRKYTYDKKGRVKSYVQRQSDQRYMFKHTYKFSYNKNDQITKMTEQYRSENPYENTYTYDSKGNLSSIYFAHNSESYNDVYVKFKNSYNKNNCLSKISVKSYKIKDNKKVLDSSKSKTYKIKYKKITVPESYVETIEQQQKAILNSYNDIYYQVYLY